MTPSTVERLRLRLRRDFGRTTAHLSVRSQLPAIRREILDVADEHRAGWMRGIDFYPPDRLRRAMTYLSWKFYCVHGYCPNLIEPQGFNERVIRRKFFGWVKVPESGNRLLTSSFIPSRLQAEVRCPPIVWSGPGLDWAKLEHLLSPGSYYLKSTHGSGWHRRFAWPLGEAEMRALSEVSAQWLLQPYGLPDGEWWYNVYTPELVIERDVGGDGYSVNCFCFKGDVGLVVLFSKATRDKITLGPDLDFIGGRTAGIGPQASGEQAVLQQIRRLAGELSEEVEFARFDFLVSDSAEIFLGEVTFSPGGGYSRRPDGIDERLGRMWSDRANR